MPNGTSVLATAQTRIDQHDLLVTPPTRTTSLPTPRRRHGVLLHAWHSLLGSWAKRRLDQEWSNPDYPRWETVPERVARTEPYLYIRSLSG
jgi:hypothetical protein